MEIFDGNHVAFGKSITKICKGIGEYCKRAFLKACKIGKDDPELTGLMSITCAPRNVKKGNQC